MKPKKSKAKPKAKRPTTTKRKAPARAGHDKVKTVLQSARARARMMWAPPPRLTVSQWADSFRFLSPEASAEPGKWYTERAPYLRGIMDALSDPAIEDMAWMSSAQVGKTEVLLNTLGYYVHQDPAPILLLQPTLEMAETFSKDRLAPMLRDCPALTGKVADPKSRNTGNTLLHKTYAGGHITMAGSNSPASLASRPIRVVLCDEVDRYPKSAGSEGDPVSLAFKRTTTFWNRKKVRVSTPTVKGESAIEAAYNLSDQRHFYVPCPHCGEFQQLRWKDDTGYRVVWQKDEQGRPLPETAAYVCPHCGAEIDLDAEKGAMLRAGEWRAHNPGARICGFHLNELYSPWRRLAETVQDFLEAKGDPEKLRAWVNTALGEPWDARDQEEVQAVGLMARREVYRAQVPAGVCVLTAGADTQKDRIEVVVKGWGQAGESWLVHREIIFGSPAMATTWEALDRLLLSTWKHANGHTLRIEAACVDSGGHFTQEVYSFCKGRAGRRVFPVKGSSTAGHPLWKRSTGKRGVRLVMIGTDTAKDSIHARLLVKDPGPGFMHFPSAPWCDEDYFHQLTSEHAVSRKSGGQTRRVWEKITPDARNEALDMEVYALAALSMLNVRDWDKRLAALAESVEAPAGEAEKPAEPPKKTVITARGGRSRNRMGW